MTRIRGLVCVLLAIAISAIAARTASTASYIELPYSAAFVDYKGKLAVFPFKGQGFAIDLPASLTRITYAANGKSLYGFGQPREARVGLLRISFNPPRPTTVPATGHFRLVSGVAVAAGEEIAFISGQYADGPNATCGLFELKLSDGDVKKIMDNPACEYSRSWVRLSISPDMKRLVGYRRPKLEVIDLDHRTIRGLGEQFVGGAWSPDGKWLAVLEGEGRIRTVLLDSVRMTRARVLGTSNLQWSPDSRFLLGQRAGGCAPEWTSLVAIDVESGKEVGIPNSTCRVNLNTTGWVNVRN